MVAGPPAAEADRDEARALLGVLASAPRPAGGAEESAVREHCAGLLRQQGFDVVERPFAYSALPGRFGTPLGGAVSIVLAIVGCGMGAAGRRGAGLVMLVAVDLLLAAAGAWLARRGVLALPWLRGRSVNLEARRGGATPRVWLVAHLDSKSQPVSIGLRAAGVTASIVAWMLIVLALSRPAGSLPVGVWIAAALFATVAGLPVAASFVDARSPGALDNASGVATVLMAAARIPTEAPVGVLLTSAEELGLAGARAWVGESHVAPGIALNVDGVDDTGRATCMYTRPRPRRLIAAVGAAARALGVAKPRARRLIPGILTDGIALADAGWEVVTVSRGTLRTLARIHGPGDVVERLTGVGVAETATLLAAAARHISSEPA